MPIRKKSRLGRGNISTPRRVLPGREAIPVAVLEKVMRGASRALGIDPPDDDELLYRDDDDLVAHIDSGDEDCEDELEHL